MGISTGQNQVSLIESVWGSFFRVFSEKSNKAERLTASWIFLLLWPLSLEVDKTVKLTGGLAFDGNESEPEGPPPDLVVV